MENAKILIVDDDSNICELIRLYLEKNHFSTVIANDCQKALKLVDEEKPDLVLLDVMMPRLDGWQVCREMRKTLQTPIIMLTAKGEVFDKVLGLELGADDYITKPFDTKELVARVKAVLRRTVQNTPEEESGYVEEFEKAAAELEIGGTVLCESEYGWHIIRRYDMFKKFDR